MDVDEAIRHYRDLRAQDWMGESCTWTVIIGDDQPLLDVTEVATSLSGGAPPEIMKERPSLALDYYRYVNLVVPARSGSHLNLIEPGVIHTNNEEFLQWMSMGRRIWSTSWHIKGGEKLLCVENGETLFGVGEFFDTDRPFGADVASYQRELDIMRHTDILQRNAAALAIMELHGGFRLTAEWLDSPQTVITVDHPIAPGATAPSAFASAEPDLAAHLHEVSPAARRSFLLRLIEQLTDRYDLHVPEVTAVLGHIRISSHPTAGEWHDLAAETLYLAQGQWPFADPTTAEPEWLRWQAAIAVRHALRSLDTGAQNLEALLPARKALHDEWENFREEILALPKA
ncbi:hypothetical protein [Nonomuraea typhae]|uniref:Uncharacterized protein n=1 Tax=Nonomuraea typhae TaxID=2603600 RepID=A0ABW7YPI6_9ACTN